MKRFTFSLFALGLLVASPALAQDHSGHAAGMAHDKTSAAYMEAMKRMDAAMASAPMSGKPGVDFAEMMIPHHQSAIDMAKAYLESGENDPTITKIARDVVASQEREIAELRDWLKAHGGQ
ncbi:DUF305 domain-containing protein [Aureimonas sp. AU20]|uniref:DUF305 domain-containing protein n=1 Tax=Aureimonas sp. AU20 TaxID=1349819 RepID=UPI000721C8CD|nr:DUF305 domain-containing protein [Aureimonas sp. AU20]ALN72885.1 hypothetical protein M673_09165 [Aureimonas sp. AU20]